MEWSPLLVAIRVFLACSGRRESTSRVCLSTPFRSCLVALATNRVTIIDAFEAVSACSLARPHHACRGRRDRTRDLPRREGACGGMYTANTMASAAEAMGMSLPGSAAPPRLTVAETDLRAARARPSLSYSPGESRHETSSLASPLRNAICCCHGIRWFNNAAASARVGSMRRTSTS